MHRCHPSDLPRLILITLIVLASMSARAQLLTPGDHHLRLGEPPLLTLRVRLPDGQDVAGQLPPRCLSASLQPLDPQEGRTIPLEWQDAQRDGDGSTWVTLGHPAPLRLLRMLLRATLHCGPAYSRLQQLESEPALSNDDSAAARHLPVSLPLPTPVPAPTPMPPPPKPRRTPPRPLSTAVVPAPAASMAEPSITRTPNPPPSSPWASSPSPLTDAFVQTWQKDLHELRDRLQPLQRQLDAQEQRLLAQEDQRLASLGGLFALGAGLALVGLVTRAWRERRLRPFRFEGPQALTPPTPLTGPSPPEPDDEGLPQALVHDDFAPMGASPLASLDESRHQALCDEVDALLGTGRLDAAVALLEAALQGDVEQAPGLLLRLLDLHRRLGQVDAHRQVAQSMSQLYAIEVPDISDCERVDEIDPEGARQQLLARRPSLAGRSNADTRQRLAEALTAGPGQWPLDWRSFQTALAWHAELATREDQTSTRSMPPLLACCT